MLIGVSNSGSCSRSVAYLLHWWGTLFSVHSPSLLLISIHELLDLLCNFGLEQPSGTVCVYYSASPCTTAVLVTHLMALILRTSQLTYNITDSWILGPSGNLRVGFAIKRTTLDDGVA